MASFFTLALVPAGYTLAVTLIISRFFRRTQSGEGGSRWIIAGIMVILLLVRVVLAASLEGHAGDVQTFQAWAMRAAEDFRGFYSGKFFADYPPGYMYVLYLIGKLKELLLLPDRCIAFQLLIKLPAIFADLALVMFIYRLGDRQVGRRPALALALIYGLNPAVILDSSVWGQVDGVFTLFIVLSVHCLSENRLTPSVGLFAAALLIKPQALIFTPLFLAVATELVLIRPERDAARRVALATTAGMLVFAVGVSPFVFTEGILWIFRHYRTTLTSYPFASVNAYNLFALSGANFVSETTPWFLFSYRNWGTFFIVLATLCSMRIYFRGEKEDRLYLMGAFLISAVFTLASRMHERYLFPVLALTLLAALRGRSRVMFFLFTGFSITHYLNVAQVLLASTGDVHQIPSSDPLLLATAAVNLLLFGYLVYHLARIRFREGIPAPLDNG
ncbi:glycosyltransferase 87 family protein [Geotalea sp. SG265]|uniref:glycosyltransferase 87 family protein n=1 Tax=Geotalea sp. SG265 TaxID=2922867 RepID=UPI001FAFCD5F|nr:glycosyltransferase 87 family protein [Geotalea sp. SG265]